MGNPTRLLEAARLKGYWDNYVNYLDKVDEREDRIGQGTQRDPYTDVFIYPFNLEFNFANQRVKAGVDPTTWSNNKSSFGTNTRDSWEGVDQQVLRVPGFRPAKVILVTIQNGGNGVRTESKRTKRPYLKYESTSRGVPFGRAAENDAEDTVFKAIKDNFTLSRQFKIARQREKA